MALDNLGAKLAAMPIEELHVLRWRMKWKREARLKQLPPPEPWKTWGIRSGRGWGKTKTGANWIGLKAALNPGTYNFIVAPTHDDVKETCMAGPTGTDNCIPPELIVHTDKSLPSRTLWNGSFIRGFAAQSPERLRGPQCLVGETMITMGGHSQKRIDEIEAGEYVLTRKGPRKVARAWLSRKGAQLWCLEAGISTMLYGTMSHRIFVDGEGFIPLWKLKKGHQLCSVADSTIAGRKTVISSTSIALGRDQRESGNADICIAMSMGAFMARLRAGASSITLTKIQAITSLPIFCSSRALSTLSFMQRIVLLVQKPAKSIPRIFSRCGALLQLLKRAASYVTVPFRFALLPQIGVANSVPCFAWKDGAVVTMPQRISHAFAVESCSGPNDRKAPSARRDVDWNIEKSMGSPCQAMSVSSVSRCERRADVYDIEVDEEHEFFANGILVHNCHALWADEIASWSKPKLAWDNLKFGHRLGTNPQLLWTSTLKPTPFIRNLVRMPGAVIVSGSTYENADNLAPTFMEDLLKYEGTAIGRQEIYGELLDPEDAGYIRRSQWQVWPKEKPLPRLHFIVMSLDTAFTEKTFNVKEQENDPSACSVWGVFEMDGKAQCILLDAWEEHLGFPELIKKVKKERESTYGAADLPLANERGPMYGAPLYGKIKQATGRPCDLILIEDKGSGISLRQALATEDVLTHPYNPGKMDKLARLHAVSPLFAHKRVWAVESAKNPGQFRSWAEPLVSQVCTYVGPGSTEHDDLLDSTTQALKYISDRFMGAFTLPVKSKEHRIAEEIAARDSGKRVNVYAQ